VVKKFEDALFTRFDLSHAKSKLFYKEVIAMNTFLHTEIYTHTKQEHRRSFDCLRKLDSEDLLSVVRFTHKKLIRGGRVPVLSEAEAVEALRQYYALPILEYPRQRFAISSIVDEYWHWYILDTRGWRDFCHN